MNAERLSLELCPGSEEVVGVVEVAEDRGVEVAVEEVSSGRVVESRATPLLPPQPWWPSDLCEIPPQTARPAVGVWCVPPASACILGAVGDLVREDEYNAPLPSFFLSFPTSSHVVGTRHTLANNTGGPRFHKEHEWLSCLVFALGAWHVLLL